MALPKIECPSGKVETHGAVIEVRGLTRAELHAVRQMAIDGASLADSEAQSIAFGTGEALEVVKAWLGTVPSDVAEALSEKIGQLSGIFDGASEGNE